MAQITLGATPKGNGYQWTITYSYGVSISSAEPQTAADIDPNAMLRDPSKKQREEALTDFLP
jgi:hypothetical protein